MKGFFTLTIATLMFLSVVTVTAEAQVFGSQRMRAHIPFAFNVGKTPLPAGEYTVTVLNSSSDRKVLQIRSIDGKLSALIHTTGVNNNTPDDAKLVFNRYGNKYFFSQAQMPGESTTLAAVKSRTERNEEQALASKQRKATVAMVAK